MTTTVTDEYRKTMDDFQQEFDELIRKYQQERNLPIEVTLKLFATGVDDYFEIERNGEYLLSDRVIK